MAMKVGDLVMFCNTNSRYAKWFYGQLGIVKSYTKALSGGWCRVTWLQPVKYHDSFSTYSDFSSDNFEVMNERR